MLNRMKMVYFIGLGIHPKDRRFRNWMRNYRNKYADRGVELNKVDITLIMEFLTNPIIIEVWKV